MIGYDLARRSANKGRKKKPRMWTQIPDQAYTTDDAIMDSAVGYLRDLARLQDKEQPFFLAVGVHAPHLPWRARSEFFNMYPMEQVQLPERTVVSENCPSMAPNYFQNIFTLTFAELADVDPTIGTFNSSSYPDDLTRQMRRCYLACSSYADHSLGKILDELRFLGLEEDTIVSFWSDHGFSLGETGSWGKSTTYERDTRVPFMIRVPGVTDQGLETDRLVELVDIFPTLVEAAGLPQVPECPERQADLVQTCTEGSSLMDLFSGDNSPVLHTTHS